MQDGNVVSPRVNRDGQERGFVQFILGQLGLDPLHVVRNDWTDVQAVREQKSNGEGGVGTFL